MNDKTVDESLSLYCNLMSEIKMRTSAIVEILKGRATTTYQNTNIEFMCLQIRKILELISMGSLVVNREEFDAIGKKYSEYWNAKLILQDVERLNSDFYPIPIQVIQSNEPEVVNELKKLNSGFLTREDFVKIYDKCGRIMHSYNPFGSKIDYEFYNANIKNWLNLIIGLLNTHLVHIKGIEGFYLIHMKENRDENVHGYYFGIEV